MEVRKLNYAEFLLEKQKILELVSEWEKEAKDKHNEKAKELIKNNSFFSDSLTKNRSISYQFWSDSLMDMKSFLKKELSKEAGEELEKNGFAFFIAHSNGAVKGIALLDGIHNFTDQANEFFGVKLGSQYEVQDIIISASSMIDRYYPAKDKLDNTVLRTEKELIKSIVQHVRGFGEPKPIIVRPHFQDDYSATFFTNNAFQRNCGAFGISFTLEVNAFPYINNTTQIEKIAGNDVLVIENYSHPNFV
jgi:hypothetical protein